MKYFRQCVQNFFNSNRRTGRGTLIIVALLFGASAIARLSSGSGQAIAREIAEIGSTEQNLENSSECIPAGSIGELVATLNERESKLVSQEQNFQERMQTLKIAEDQFHLNMAALDQAEESLAKMISVSNSAAEDDLQKLTSVYENMKPAEASKLFSEMNPTFSAGFISRMRPDSAALVLAGLPPKMAYTISVILAGRNAEAPTD